MNEFKRGMIHGSNHCASIVEGILQLARLRKEDLSYVRALEEVVSVLATEAECISAAIDHQK